MPADQSPSVQQTLELADLAILTCQKMKTLLTGLTPVEQARHNAEIQELCKEAYRIEILNFKKAA
jgi:hypothetical protein